MKTKLFLLLSLCSLLAAGCASSPDAGRDDLAPSALATPAANLLIVSAVYGSGTNYVDVTDRVNALLHQPGVEFFARPEWLHADPTPGWNKALVIVYEFKGQRRLFTAGEGGRVTARLLTKKPHKK